jgi:hypothetical protein
MLERSPELVLMRPPGHVSQPMKEPALSHVLELLRSGNLERTPGWLLERSLKFIFAAVP